MSLVNYNPFTKVLTIETTSPESFEDITMSIPAQKMILRHYRIDIDLTGRVESGNEYRRVVNLELGSVVGSTYVLDDDAGFNYFKIGLSRDEVWTHPEITVPAAIPTDPPVVLAPSYVCQSTVRDCYIPLTMNGELTKNFYVRARDNRHELFTTQEFRYMFLQFEVTGEF